MGVGEGSGVGVAVGMGVGEGSRVGVAAGMGDGGVEEVGAGAQAARSRAARKRIGMTTRANWCILMYREVISNQYSVIS
jgi:hypothetical protein